jgi:hypothetical protein
VGGFRVSAHQSVHSTHEIVSLASGLRGRERKAGATVAGVGYDSWPMGEELLLARPVKERRVEVSTCLGGFQMHG